MVADPKEQSAAQSTAAGSGSPALDWAVGNFRFDPHSRGDRQQGVVELQGWLEKNGAKVTPDGLLGPATLAALERVFFSMQPPESEVEVEAEAASKFETEATQGFAQQAAPQSEAPGSDAAAEQDADRPAADDIAAASARPVALSDSAIEDVSQDRLGFAPYVDAVAEFILAEQTRPPLSLVINAQWGQGKTSFMNMLDGRLKEKSGDTTVRVATTWFNPWKYSEPAQVWAAFVANVTRCVRANLTPRQLWRFKRDRFVDKMKRHADFPLILRLLVAFIFVLLVISLPFTLDLPAFHAGFKDDKGGILGAFYAATQDVEGWLWWLLFVPFALLSVLYGYITFTKGLGLNLLEYVEKTDFKDKIGTLSQFESEMRRLADAVPEDLKVVVFIDDLDRCKGRVLGEIIEALQLADVSRSCIFVMGMDLQIVATAIETERSELAASAGRAAEMEHGSGYKFLEKIIQARLALPAHGQRELAQLVTSAMGSRKQAGQETGPGQEQTDQPARTAGMMEATLNTLTGRGRERRETPSDSIAVIEAAEHYGSRHFSNPRRLKRFINSFRLQAYLADAVLPAALNIDHLARFLVLAEKWPALLHYLVTADKGAEFLQDDQSMGTYYGMAEQVRRLREDNQTRVIELLTGRDGEDPLAAPVIQSLAAWTGFSYYPGLEAKSAGG